jgi:hypothetical protein
MFSLNCETSLQHYENLVHSVDIKRVWRSVAGDIATSSTDGTDNCVTN